MSFQQGLSGLNVSSKALDTIGNNISNSSTVGFKSGATQFADVFAASLTGGGGSQIGIGAQLASVTQQFTQGNITNTNNPLDMSINGAGFYRMNNNGTITYSRAGQFHLDKDGYIVNTGSLKLTGYAADPTTGTISPGNLTPLQVVNTNIAPKATTASTMALNFDSRALPPASMSSGSLTGVKALGATTPIAAAANVLDLVVDGNAVSVTIPPNAAGYSAANLATTLQSLINSGLSGKGASVTVLNTTNGLVITSNSKGTVGSSGLGSSVTLNPATLGGPAASILLGAPTATAGTAGPTAGFLTGGLNLPTSVTIGSGESFNLTVNGTTKTVSVPAGTYSTVGAPSALQSTLQAAITAQFPGPGATVVANSGAPLTITSTTTGVASSISVGTMTSGVQTLFGPTTIAGADNFNQVTSTTSGTLTSQTALAAPNITAANNTLSVTVDGNAITATLTVANYNGAPLTLANLATDVQTQINNQLALVVPATTARVSVSVNASNKLVITSNSLGSTSTVALTGTGGTAGPVLFGATPVTLAGTQTQTVNPLGFTASTAQTVYDSQGNPHNLSLYFVKTSQPNVWQMYSTLDGGQQNGPTQLAFDTSGNLTTSMPVTLPATGSSYSFAPSATNASQPASLQFTLDLRGTTQYGVNFGVNTLSQDGYSSGQLSGISVDSTGVIQGRYSNGKSKNLGQIVLVNFNNPAGLQALGNNQWAESLDSGQNIPGTPGTGSLGLIQSAAVEESNVDLTKELVDMITQQRVYQANAQTIKTQDQILQTLVNLR